MAKRYYWLQLKEDFFGDLPIKALRRLPGGDTMLIIYLRMQLLSLKSGAVIKFGGILPTTEEEISMILEEDVVNVRATIAYLEKVGVIERLPSNDFFLPDTVKNIGSESDSAERMRRFRENLKIQGYMEYDEQKKIPSQCDANVTEEQKEVTASHCDKNVTLYIDIDKDKDKELELKINKEGVYGEFKNVFLKKEEYEKLLETMSLQEINTLIEDLSLYMTSQGKSYKSHYATLKAWHNKNKKAIQDKNKKKADKFLAGSKHDWDFKEIERLNREQAAAVVNSTKKGGMCS